MPKTKKKVEEMPKNDTDKVKALDLALAQIEKDYGKVR